MHIKSFGDIRKRFRCGATVDGANVEIYLQENTVTASGTSSSLEDPRNETTFAVEKRDDGEDNEGECKSFRSIETESFYPTPTLSTLLRRRHLFTAPVGPYLRFNSQQDAFDCCDSHTESLHVFSKEKEEGGGKRYYIATSYEEFWRRYQLMEKSVRNFYEVIREGHACKLYFDLECAIAQPNLSNDVSENIPLSCDGVATKERMIMMVNEFIVTFCEFLGSKDNTFINNGEQVKVPLPIKGVSPSNFLCLDSSNDVKFSHHIILITPNIVFKNNVEAGYLVFAFIQYALNKDLMKRFCVKNPVSQEYCCIIDSAVYTRNRNFRIYGSTKIHSNRYLRLSACNRYPFPDNAVQREMIQFPELNQQIFHASLISNVSFDPAIEAISCPIMPLPPASYVFSYDGESKQATFIPKHSIQTSFYSSGNSIAIRNDIWKESTPYPKIEEYIQQCGILRKGGSSGKVRSWCYFPATRSLILQITGNRYCARIGRQHKSNHILLVVDIANRCFYQRCLDPDCRSMNFRSEPYVLPEELFPSVTSSKMKSAEFDGTFLDDELLIAALEEEETKRNCTEKV